MSIIWMRKKGRRFSQLSKASSAAYGDSGEKALGMPPRTPRP